MSKPWCSIRVEFNNDGTDGDTVNMILHALAGLNVRLTMKGVAPLDAVIIDTNAQVPGADSSLDNAHGFKWQRIDADARTFGPVEHVLYQDVEAVQVY